MIDGNVYYCWSCDAHRKVTTQADRTACCPACGEILTEDSRLPSHSPTLQIPSFVISLPLIQPAQSHPTPSPRRRTSAAA